MQANATSPRKETSDVGPSTVPVHCMAWKPIDMLVFFTPRAPTQFEDFNSNC